MRQAQWSRPPVKSGAPWRTLATIRCDCWWLFTQVSEAEAGWFSADTPAMPVVKW